MNQNLMDEIFNNSELIYEQKHICEGILVEDYLVANNGEYYTMIKNNGIWVMLFRESI